MKYDIKFKTIDHSPALVEYVQARFDKVERYAIKPVTVHVTFSEERHNCCAEVYIHGLNGEFRAHFRSDSFYVSLDMCVKRIERQMEREKDKVKHHHSYENSSAGFLDDQLILEANSRTSRSA